MPSRYTTLPRKRWSTTATSMKMGNWVIRQKSNTQTGIRIRARKNKHKLFHTMSTSKQTNDHDTIKKWVEERGGMPAKVSGTRSGDDESVLRIHFSDHSNNDD